MPQKKYHSSDLGIGSLVRDVQTGDLGLLVERTDLFEKIEGHSHNRHIPFIEEAIIGLLNGGVWELKDDETD